MRKNSRGQQPLRGDHLLAEHLGPEQQQRDVHRGAQVHVLRRGVIIIIIIIIIVIIVISFVIIIISSSSIDIIIISCIIIITTSTRSFRPGPTRAAGSWR